MILLQFIFNTWWEVWLQIYFEIYLFFILYKQPKHHYAMNTTYICIASLSLKLQKHAWTGKIRLLDQKSLWDIFWSISCRSNIWISVHWRKVEWWTLLVLRVVVTGLSVLSGDHPSSLANTFHSEAHRIYYRKYNVWY